MFSRAAYVKANEPRADYRSARRREPMAVTFGPSAMTATSPTSSRVQDEIAHSIVDALKVRLLPQESRAILKVPTTNIEAYQFYLRGRQFLNRCSVRSYEVARRMFARAIEIDPGYAQAHAGIADSDAFRCLIELRRLAGRHPRSERQGAGAGSGSRRSTRLAPGWRCRSMSRTTRPSASSSGLCS